MRGQVRMLVVSALFAAAMVCETAYAQLTTTTYGPFAVSCSSGTQLCNNTYSQTVVTVSNLRVQYTASSGHCSNVRAHILVDGVEKALTAFLTPGQASGFFDVGPVTQGNHVVALRGEGTVGGCNVGILLDWGGTMSVTTDVVVAQAIPASTPQTLLLTAALLIAATFGLRRYVKRRT